MSMENSTEKIINEEQILDLLKNVGGALNESGVDYLVCGSLAFKLVTGEDIKIHDIDIIVHETDFEKLRTLLSDPIYNLDPIQTEVSIHANHKLLIGSDGKPFDISLDSFEYYYSKVGVDMTAFKEVNINGTNIRVARVEDMIKVYKKALTGGNVEKYPEYERKLRVLEGLI